MKFNVNIQNWISWKVLINMMFFRLEFCTSFISYIFSITGQSCHLPNHLNLLSPTGCTYHVLYGYHLKFVCFLLSASSAQSAFEFPAFQWIFWYCLQQFSHFHSLKCIYYDMILLDNRPNWNNGATLHVYATDFP